MISIALPYPAASLKTILLLVTAGVKKGLTVCIGFELTDKEFLVSSTMLQCLDGIGDSLGSDGKLED